MTTPSEEGAKLIVDSMNSHTALVEALKLTLKAIGTGDTYHICVGPGTNDTLGDHLKKVLAAVEGEG